MALFTVFYGFSKIAWATENVTDESCSVLPFQLPGLVEGTTVPSTACTEAPELQKSTTPFLSHTVQSVE